MPFTLVTGGAIRLGAEICKHLANKGHQVVIHYNHSEHEAQKLAKECRAETIQGDFSTHIGLMNFIDRYKKKYQNTAFIVNNVGNYLVKSSLETSPKELIDLYQTNVFAPFTIIKELVDSLKQNKGSIVNIGATGVNAPRADIYSSVYTMTKQSLSLLTKSLAKELAPSYVKVNMVSPGLLDNAVDLEKELPFVPMKRPGTLLEVARVVEFLLNRENEYITGQNIEVGGGIRL